MRHLLSKKDIIIDLTSLLDVIFIVLMVVMFSQNLQNAQAGDSDNASREISSEEMHDHYEKYEYLDQYVVFIDVDSSIRKSAEEFMNDPEHRRTLCCIKGIGEGEERVRWVDAQGDESEYIDITDSTEKDIIGKGGRLDVKLRNMIDAAVQSSEQSEYGKAVIILSVNRNDDKILYRDEYKISKLLEEIAESYADDEVTIAVR